MKHAAWICLVGLMAAVGCGTIGNQFDSPPPGSIVNHKTTKQDIRTLYGEPHRKGVENGNLIWVYEYSTYNVFGRNTSKDMIVVFDKNDIVQSHQYMANDSSP
ncbi:MAG: hypothetical protein VYC17_04570 [Nitrospinota bacterium]|nr:hypothetical protein [Nitrospinota bacterium]